MATDETEFADGLDRFLDEVVEGADHAPNGSPVPEPLLSSTIRQLRAYDDALLADPRFADRLLEDLMHTQTIPVSSHPRPLFPRNHPASQPGRASASPQAPPPPRGSSMIAHVATAALLALTLVAGLVAFGPWRPGSAPPAGNHQLAAVPAAATPDAQPALAEFVGEIWLDPDGTERSSAAAGVAVDDQGTLYVIDGRKDQIRVFDRDGTAVATWGERGEGPGQFKFQAMGYNYGDLAIGPDGNLYVMDTANSRIQVFSPDGTYLREWGEPGRDEGQLSAPSGIAIDASGRVYVTETGNRRLQIFDSDGQFVAAWEPSEAEGGPFLDPADVAIDAAGVVSVTDYDKNRIFRFDAEGAGLETLGLERQYQAGEAQQPGYLSQPWGVAVDPQDNLYVAEYGGKRVHVFAPDGTSLGVIESVATEPNQYMTLIYVTVSADGTLYVADNANGRVQQFRLLAPLVATPAMRVLE